MRAVFLICAVLGALALASAPATSKEGVIAVADRPVDLGAKPGTKLRVFWHLEDADGRRFGAGGIYLRVSRCGRGPLLVPARDRGRGRFSARFTVPRRGIRKLMVGLEGWRIYPDGRKERADRIFNFVPALGRPCG